MTESPRLPTDEMLFSNPPEAVLEMAAQELNTIAGMFEVKLVMMDRLTGAGKPEQVIQHVEALHRINQALIRVTDLMQRYAEQRKKDEG